MTTESEKRHVPWFLWPFWAIWQLVAWIIGLTGRLVAVILGLALMIVGVVLSLTVIGAIFGIPLFLIGVLLVFHLLVTIQRAVLVAANATSKTALFLCLFARATSAVFPIP
jgi:hypothetical protein